MRSALIVFLIALPSFAQRPDSCSDPYWKGTLRCTAFPNESPQPNRHQIPTSPQQVQPFTRVWLDADPSLRCADGTAPMLYVDKAICTNASGCGPGIRLGDPVESNKWVFTFQGGDSCRQGRCVTFYATAEERPNMGSSNNPPMRDIEGIVRPDPVRNPVFSGYNRVKVDKCTFDRYMGRTTEVYDTTAPNGTSVRLNFFHHGFLITEAAFATLASGLQYPTWTTSGTVTRRRSCCNGESAGKVAQTYEKLPPLANAEVVLLVGHSNACHGMFHNADHLAAALAKIPGFKGDVRTFFDENFLPSPENEAAFATSSTPAKDAYDGITTGTTAARAEPFSYDARSHFETDNAALEYATHGAVLDASCVEAHASDGQAWKCKDRHHVLMNHVSTPFLVREDFLDPGREHLDSGNGHEARWGTDSSFSWCPDGQPCNPRFTPQEFRARLEKQIKTMLDFASTRSEMARGSDRGTFPTFFAWMPNCGMHDGAYSDGSFFGSKIAAGASTVSLREWVEEFMKAPRVGVRQSRVDGVDGARTVQCK